MMDGAIGIVAIGRNEGTRLTACLASLPKEMPIVYVDSASSDDSVERARSFDVGIVEFKPGEQLSAARARNAGLDALVTDYPALELVQLLDGDCVLESGWLAAARSAFDSDPSLAVVFGRRRESHPETTIYNALCDDEWNVRPGYVLACGGDAMVRIAAFRQVGGFNAALVAGEEPDLCLRLGQKGWRMLCLADAMTVHDADISRLSQWWRRAKRAGLAYAEHVFVHRGHAFQGWKKQVLSILAWALALPLLLALVVIALPPAWPWALALGPGLYGLQVLRMAARKYRQGSTATFALAYGWFMMLAKFAQLSGLVSFGLRILRRARPTLIEYKVA